MNISYALGNSLSEDTFAEKIDGWYNRVYSYPCYENNNVFSRFLEVVLSYDEECFIPVLGISSTIPFIHKWLNAESPAQFVKLSFPLYVGGTEERKTADSIIQSINRCPRNLRLSNIKTSKGLDYYGGQGLILDEHWNPMMLCGFIIKIDRINRSIHIVRPICYISPNVFENNDILSRAILKKVIPYMSIHGINPPIFRSISYLNFSYDTFKNVLVTICPIDKYFVAPESPTEIEELDNSIWSFLRENINDLM